MHSRKRRVLFEQRAGTLSWFQFEISIFSSSILSFANKFFKYSLTVSIWPLALRHVLLFRILYKSKTKVLDGKKKKKHCDMS